MALRRAVDVSPQCWGTIWGSISSRSQCTAWCGIGLLLTLLAIVSVTVVYWGRGAIDLESGLPQLEASLIRHLLPCSPCSFS